MRQVLIGAGLCAILAWGLMRDPGNPAPNVNQAEFFALGTLIQIKSAKPLDNELIASLQTQLSEFEKQWSILGHGPLSKINETLSQSNHSALAAELRSGFETAKRACAASHGLFDPALGRLVSLWGFDDESSFRDTPPDQQEIAVLLDKKMSLCTATLDPQLGFPSTGARLNFGASAKGRAVNLLLATLQQAGHQQAIVNAGGDLKVSGQAPNRPWRIGIRHPRPDKDGDPVLAKLDVESGEAVFTSGDYERYFISQGQRYHHIIDPRNGYPAHQSQSATVIHSDAEWADAASTALFVAGPELAAETMKNMRINTWLLIDSHGDMHASAAMQARLAEPQDTQ